MKKKIGILITVLTASGLALFFGLAPGACGSGLCNGTEKVDANTFGIGGACTSDAGCASLAAASDAITKCVDTTTTATSLSCITTFTGGYCGKKNCTGNADCPSGSACVRHTDGINYCFLTCTEKSQCNTYRSKSVEANCSSNITFVDGNTSTKACVPP